MGITYIEASSLNVTQERNKQNYTRPLSQAKLLYTVSILMWKKAYYFQ